jgi:hypothetical protein
VAPRGRLASAAMERWEYRNYPPFLAKGSSGEVSRLLEEWFAGLNELGAQGWDAVTPLSVHGSWGGAPIGVLLLRRPLAN